MTDSGKETTTGASEEQTQNANPLKQKTRASGTCADAWITAAWLLGGIMLGSLLTIMFVLATGVGTKIVSYKENRYPHKTTVVYVHTPQQPTSEESLLRWAERKWSEHIKAIHSSQDWNGKGFFHHRWPESDSKQKYGLDELTAVRQLTLLISQLHFESCHRFGWMTFEECAQQEEEWCWWLENLTAAAGGEHEMFPVWETERNKVCSLYHRNVAEGIEPPPLVLEPLLPDLVPYYPPKDDELCEVYLQKQSGELVCDDDNRHLYVTTLSVQSE